MIVIADLLSSWTTVGVHGGKLNSQFTELFLMLNIGLNIPLL